MLFMAIEGFQRGDAKPIGERFRRGGRMLPEGVEYQASWVDPAGARCFQIMEAANPELLHTGLPAGISREELVFPLTSGYH